MQKKSLKKPVAQISYAIIPILRENEVIRSSLFGSYATGDEKHDSDIDLLVELPKNKSLFDLIDLKRKLQEKLNKKVDVVTYDSLSPLLKEQILQEQVKIYEKGS